jgi:hypothetical protein
MTLTIKDIQNALDHIDRLRPACLNLSAKRGFSLREAILLMAPKLTEKKELGFSTKDLAAALAEREIIIKPPTLNRYLCEYQAAREKAVSTEAATAVPPELTAAPPDEIEPLPGAVQGVFAPEPSDRPEPFTAVSDDYERLF